MSFADSLRGGAGNDAPYQSFGDGSGFSMPTVKKELRANIKHIAEMTAEIGKLSKQIGEKGVPDARERVFALINAVRDTARVSLATLRQAEAMVPASHQAELSGLQDELRTALSKFHTVAESASHAVGPTTPRDDVMPEAIPLADAIAIRVHRDEATAPLMASDIQLHAQQQPQELQEQPGLVQEQVLQQSIALRQDVIDERDQGIAAVQQSVRDVHEIFQDLALLVHEQGTQVDNIQTNVENAAARVHRGVGELQTAQRSQRRYRRKLCTMAVLAVMGIFVFIGILKFALKVAVPL